MSQPARIAAVAAALVLVASMAAAQDTPVGVYVDTPDGPQEVAHYAVRTPSGRLRLAAGTLDDVQKVGGLIRMLFNLPHWRVRTAFLATGRILVDERSERRMLKLRARRLSVTAMVVQVVASEEPAELDKLLTAVGATPEQPAYVFVTLESGGSVRDYIVQVDTDP